MNPDTVGDSRDTFLATYPNDNHLCDDTARWWLEWHIFTLDDNNVPVYGARMLFSQKRKLNLKICTLWSNNVHLIA